MNLFFHTFYRFRTNSLYRNSFWLMSGAFTMAGVGFFYWLIAARLYTPGEIGLGATFLSVASLINLISMLGFNNTLIRFLPTSKNKQVMINTSLSVISLMAFSTGLIYVMGITFFTEKLSFLTDSFSIFLLILLFFPINIVNTALDSIFSAYKDTKWVFVSNLVQSTGKLIFLFFLSIFGSIGIIGSNFLGTLLALIFCLVILYSKFHLRIKLALDSSTINKVKFFSMGNYLSGIFGGLPNILLPIIITNRLSPEQTAYFYMPNMIASILTIIPAMVSRSYLIEGSHANEALSIKKPIIFSYAILLPIIFFLVIFGKSILNIFGENYANLGYSYLILISFSILISVFNYFMGTKLLIHNKLRLIIAINFISSATYIILSWILTSIGIIGIGISAILSQILSLILLSIIK